jgi:hypothetical protein
LGHAVELKAERAERERSDRAKRKTVHRENAESIGRTILLAYGLRF